MKKLPFSIGFCALLSITALSAACSVETREASAEDDVITKRSTLDLIKDLPLDTTWEQVPAKVKKALAQNAARTFQDYEQRLGETALRSHVSAFAKPSAAATKAFDEYVRAAYGQFLANAEQYSASTSMNPKLRGALQKLYVTRIAAWRLNVKNYGNMAPLEADGTTAIDEFPLPSATNIAAYRTVAAEAVAELRAASALSLTAEEKAVAERALDHARSHAAGSTGFRYGSEDLLTVWGRGGWAYDLVFARTEPGGKFLQDDAKYAETLNAYYDAPLTYLDKGTLFALPFSTEMLVDPAFLAGELGAGPDTNVAAKSYMLLTRWWLERTKAHADAQKSCSIYQQRDTMWEGFTADNLFNADGKKTLAAFRTDADAEAARLLVQYKTVLIDAVKVFGAEKALPASAIASTETAVQAETRYGAVITTAAAALDAHRAGLGAELQAKLADIPTVGGYAEGDALRQADTDTVARIWTEVKGFLATTYKLDASKLQADILVKHASNSTTTGQDGKITIGIKTQRTEDYWYAILLHEAHHSYNHASGVFVEGPGWEGAAKTTELLVFPALIKKSLEARGLGAKAPYYLAKSFSGRNAFSAKTEATLDVLLRGSCGGGKDTVERAQDIARKWGITDPALIDDVAIRSHHGTSYLQYVAGEIIYTAFVEKMSAAVGQRVDPFQLQACGLTFAPDSPATVTALETCLAR